MTEAVDGLNDYINEARVLLQDTLEPYRYSNIELLSNLNVALQEVRRLRPDLFLPSFVIPHFPYTEVTPTPKTTSVPFEPMYRSALIYYMVGRAQLRDDESTTDARAASLMTKFTAQLLTINS